MLTSDIYTNAVALAKKINVLKEDGQEFSLEIVDGISKGEKVVKLIYKYCYWEDKEAE